MGDPFAMVTKLIAIKMTEVFSGQCIDPLNAPVEEVWNVILIVGININIDEALEERNKGRYTRDDIAGVIESADGCLT